MTGGTATRLPAGAVLLTGSAVESALDAVRLAQRSRRSHGLTPSVAWSRLEVVLGEGVAEVGHSDAQIGPAGEAGFMDVTAAAKLLGCSERQARRLAPALGGHKRAGVWLIDTLALREHLDGRNH